LWFLFNKGDLEMKKMAMLLGVLVGFAGIVSSEELRTGSIVTTNAGATNILLGSVAEGVGTTASGTNSHAEGHVTTAAGNYSHAEGDGSFAGGNVSHAAGQRAIAVYDNTFVWSSGDVSNSFFYASTNRQFSVYAENGIRLLGGPIEGDGSGLTNLMLNGILLEQAIENSASQGGDAELDSLVVGPAYYAVVSGSDANAYAGEYYFAGTSEFDGAVCPFYTNANGKVLWSDLNCYGADILADSFGGYNFVIDSPDYVYDVSSGECVDILVAYCPKVSVSEGNVTATGKITANGGFYGAFNGAFYGYGGGLSGLNASQISSGTINPTRLPTNGINASALTYGTLPAARLPTNGLSASALTTGTLPAARLPSSGISATAITAGTLNAARLPTNGISASAITTGRFSAAQLPTNGLNASTITEGTLNAARLPYVGYTPMHLMVSNSVQKGSDAQLHSLAVESAVYTVSGSDASAFEGDYHFAGNAYTPYSLYISFYKNANGKFLWMDNRSNYSGDWVLANGLDSDVVFCFDGGTWVDYASWSPVNISFQSGPTDSVEIVSGTVTGKFAGDGSGLTNLNVASVTGVIPSSSLPTNGINAAAMTTGTLSAARLPTNGNWNAAGLTVNNLSLAGNVASMPNLLLDGVPLAQAVSSRVLQSGDAELNSLVVKSRGFSPDYVIEVSGNNAGDYGGYYYAAGTDPEFGYFLSNAAGKVMWEDYEGRQYGYGDMVLGSAVGIGEFFWDGDYWCDCTSGNPVDNISGRNAVPSPRVTISNGDITATGKFAGDGSGLTNLMLNGVPLAQAIAGGVPQGGDVRLNSLVVGQDYFAKVSGSGAGAGYAGEYYFAGTESLTLEDGTGCLIFCTVNFYTNTAGKVLWFDETGYGSWILGSSFGDSVFIDDRNGCGEWVDYNGTPVEIVLELGSTPVTIADGTVTGKFVGDGSGLTLNGVPLAQAVANSVQQGGDVRLNSLVIQDYFAKVSGSGAGEYAGEYHYAGADYLPGHSADGYGRVNFYTNAAGKFLWSDDPGDFGCGWVLGDSFGNGIFCDDTAGEIPGWVVYSSWSPVDIVLEGGTVMPVTIADGTVTGKFVGDGSGLSGLAQAPVISSLNTRVNGHIGNHNNPHVVTVEQIGALPSAGGTVSGNLAVGGSLTVNGITVNPSAEQTALYYVPQQGDLSMGIYTQGRQP
jgi:hypothetical protein